MARMTDAKAAEAQVLRSNGLSVRAVAARLGLSRSAVARATDARPGRSRRDVEPRAAVSPGSDPWSEGQSDDAPLDLSAFVRELGDVAAAAKDDDNLALYARLMSLQLTAAALEAKLRPVPPPEPDQRPDILEAARQAREKLAGVLARMVAPA